MSKLCRWRNRSSLLRHLTGRFSCFVHNLTSHFSYRRTLQHTEARIFSRFGWGLTKKIENHGFHKFKANFQRVSFRFIVALTLSHTCIFKSREGVSVVLSLLRQSRLQPITLGAGTEIAHNIPSVFEECPLSAEENKDQLSSWKKFKLWLFQSPPSSTQN
jgi:hypothetical protein